MERKIIFLLGILVTGLACTISIWGQSGSIGLINGLEATPLIGEGDFPSGLMGVGVDNQGKIYVTRTRRLATEELSLLRSNFLHEIDMGLTTVAEKEAWIRSNFSLRIANAQGLADQNGDGVIDLEDLVQRSEEVYILEDEDNNGVMDRARLFADDFKEITTGVAHSVSPIGDSVYVTILPDLWKLKDEDGDGLAETRERLIHGFANHIGYGNHDLHCVRRGYDGKIYWTMGDRGLNVVSKEGIRWANPHSGAVVRSNLDGSEFEVFAHGLRNCQEFDFDDYGNLFSIDHDADFQGEMERLVYLIEGSDSGWRSYYQYRTTNRVLKDAAKDLYSPWLAEGMWKPLHEKQPSHFLPPIENSWNAPAAFAFQPGSALGGKYRGRFFLGGHGEIRAFEMVSDGASYRRGKTDVIGQMGSQVLSSTFGPDGRLYFMLWNPEGGRSPLWALQDAAEETLENGEVKTLLAEGMRGRSLDELAGLLGHGDRRVRLEAQYELADRNESEVLKRVASDEKALLMARIHGVWGLIQLKHWDTKLFKRLSADPNDELVAQLARWAGDLGKVEDSIGSRKQAAAFLLNHSSSRVKSLAAISCGKLRAREALGGLERMIREAENRSPVLREAGVIGLVGAASREELSKFATSESEAVRIAAVVALRRLGGTGELVAFLEDTSAQVADDAMRAIYDTADEDTFKRHPGVLDDLAARLSANSSRAANMRSLAANRRLGTSEALDRVLKFIAEADVTRKMERVMAMDVLASWTTSMTLDPLDGRYFPVDAFSEVALHSAFLAKVELLANDADPVVAERTVAILMELKATDGVLVEKAVESILNKDTTESMRLAWMEFLTSRKGDRAGKRADEVALEALSSKSFALSQAAARHLIARGRNLDAVSDRLSNALQGSAATDVFQGTLEMLKDTEDYSEVLHDLLRALMEGRLDRAVHLEVVEAMIDASEGDELLGEAYEEYQAWVLEQNPLGEFAIALEGGDLLRGESLFLGHTLAQCSKCHSLRRDTGQQIGPALEGVGDRLTRYELLESLIDPQAKVTSGYGFQTLKLKDGHMVSGTHVSGNEKQIVLKRADGVLEELQKSEIVSATTPIGAMPSMKGIVNKRDLRDLVAYLASLREN